MKKIIPLILILSICAIGCKQTGDNIVSSAGSVGVEEPADSEYTFSVGNEITTKVTYPVASSAEILQSTVNQMAKEILDDLLYDYMLSGDFTTLLSGTLIEILEIDDKYVKFLVLESLSEDQRGREFWTFKIYLEQEESEYVPNIPFRLLVTEGEYFTIPNKRHNVWYPVLNGLENQDEINNIISSEVDRIIDTYRTFESEDKVFYEVKNANNQVFSVRFDGIVNHADTPYPVKVFGSVSIDLATASILELNKIADVESEDFFDYFIENANRQLKEMFEDDIVFSDIYSDEKIKSLLKNADIREEIIIDGELRIFTESLSYISGGDLVIRLSVIHALGDYLDFVFPLLETFAEFKL